MKKILVTGANGQLGQCIQKAVAEQDNRNHQYIFVTRNELDITQPEGVMAYLLTYKFDVVINCAAYTAVDLAEEEVELAYKINAEAVGEMAKICADQGIQFIHISTDYVFDGEGETPFTEDSDKNPISVYGKSKLVGEQLAIENNPEAIIIRTAWVYSEFGKNFMKTMLRLFKDKEEIGVVSDQRGTPTNANDIAAALIKIIETEPMIPGVYHYTNAGDTTWYGFAKAIKKYTDATIKINPIETSAYPTPAKRPAFSVLNHQKIQNDYQVNCPNWEESLSELLSEMDVKTK